jgi:hypothetical protein
MVESAGPVIGPMIRCQVIRIGDPHLVDDLAERKTEGTLPIRIQIPVAYPPAEVPVGLPRIRFRAQQFAQQFRLAPRLLLLLLTVTAARLRRRGRDSKTCS